jgi:hypothetical protein
MEALQEAAQVSRPGLFQLNEVADGFLPPPVVTHFEVLLPAGDKRQVKLDGGVTMDTRYY